MTAAGWRRTGDVEYEAHLGGWSDVRPLIAAAMTAALAPLAPHFDGATSASAAAALDPARVARFSALVDRWCGGTHPEWHTRPADELGLLP
jgi:hypothetical protein